MISKFEITGRHTKVSPELQKYITRKIGKLDRYMPRHARESAHAEVLIKEKTLKTKKQYTCEVVLNLPKEKITVSQTTINPFAAVDITENTLKNRIKKYKETHSSLKLHRRVISRLKNRSPRF